MRQVYIIPQECVEHLMDDEGRFTDREKVKRIGTKCGEILTLIDFEEGINNGDVESGALSTAVILID